jgi:hypothetical protein
VTSVLRIHPPVSIGVITGSSQEFSVAGPAEAWAISRWAVDGRDQFETKLLHHLGW